MKSYTLAALVLSGLGVLGLIYTVTSHGNVRDYIAKHYQALPDEKLDNRSSTTKVYAAATRVSATVHDIAGAHKPAERRTTAEGTFLRYSDDVVAVVPRGTGSKIEVDDAGTGYRRHYFFVGGFWGRYSGAGESFRGGGPGTGK